MPSSPDHTPQLTNESKKSLDIEGRLLDRERAETNTIASLVPLCADELIQVFGAEKFFAALKQVLTVDSPQMFMVILKLAPNGSERYQLYRKIEDLLKQEAKQHDDEKRPLTSQAKADHTKRLEALNFYRDHDLLSSMRGFFKFILGLNARNTYHVNDSLSLLKKYNINLNSIREKVIQHGSIEQYVQSCLKELDQADENLVRKQIRAEKKLGILKEEAISPDEKTH